MSAATDSVPAPLQHALTRVAEGAVLSESEARAAFEAIMAGGAPAAAIAGLLVGLRARGEAASELAGAVAALRGAMQVVRYPDPASLVDTCGTGGGTVRTLNVSTAAAFVAAGTGVPIAKHGNRSFTSRSGSADVLEALGVAIDGDANWAAAILDAVGVVFLFAPVYHPAMRHVAQVRRELGVPTMMNLVGPLANPARAGRQVIGIADLSRAPTMAEALRRLATVHAMVVHADIGIDEIAPMGSTRVWEVRGEVLHEWRVEPAVFGLETSSLDGLEGGDPAENATRIQDLFAHPRQASPALRAAVILNAAAAVYVSGTVVTMEEAVDRARESLEQGAALARLESLVRASTAE